MKNKDVRQNIGFDTESVDFSKLGGLSNTPLTKDLNVKYNVCIDYLKIRFNRSFSPTDNSFKKLLTFLKVDSTIYDDDLRVANYKFCYVFDANVFLYTCGLTTKNANGEDTTILELKGQACREFEARGGSWIDLFDEIKENNGMCKRIDVAFDDYGNTIPRAALLDKIYKGLYTCDWKDKPEIVFSKNDGFSITFGKYSQKTLCIYNKVAERKDKGLAVTVNDWMRYECRFKSDVVDVTNNGVGDVAFNEVYCALVNNDLDRCAKKLLFGLIDIKEKNNYSRESLCKAPTWSIWKNFLNVDVRFKCHIQYKLETSIVRKVNWYSRSAMRNRILLEALNPSMYKDIDGYFVYKTLNKIRNKDVASINYVFDSINLNHISKDELVTFLEEKYRKYSDGNSFIDYITGHTDANGCVTNDEIKKEIKFKVGDFALTKDSKVKIIYSKKASIKDKNNICCLILGTKEVIWINEKELKEIK
ncbi:MAG: replication initiation factor domain-containing protein [Bacilli bacterium]